MLKSKKSHSVLDDCLDLYLPFKLIPLSLFSSSIVYYYTTVFLSILWNFPWLSKGLCKYNVDVYVNTPLYR